MSIFKIADGRRYLYQWDANRTLIINSNDNDITEVHFSYNTSDIALRANIIQKDGTKYVQIPQDLLEMYGMLKVYAYGENYTQYFGQIEVRERAKPDDYIYEDEEKRVWDDLKDKIEETDARVDINEEAIYNHEIRLTNLEHLIPEESFYSDTTIEYKKSVPVNACPYAQIDKVGGMTRKCTNLIPFTYKSKTVNGVTFTVNDDGTVTANGTATSDATFATGHFTILANQIYRYTGCPKGGSESTYYVRASGFSNDYGSGLAISCPYDFDSAQIITIKSGYTANNLLFKPMVSEGSTVLPYEPYFEGLRSAPVTEIESEGVNLCPVASITTQEIASGQIAISNITRHGTYTLSADITKYADDTATNTRVSIVVAYTDGTTTSVNSAFDLSSAESDGITRRKTATVSTDVTKTISTVYLLLLNYSIANSRNAKAENIQFEFNDAATEYRPYTRTTLPIPEAIQELEGYGWGINESVYNYIDYEKKQFVKRVGKVDMGTLNWDKAQNFFYAIVSGQKNGSNLLCSEKYNFVGALTDSAMNEAPIYSIASGPVANYVKVKDTSYANVTTFKTAMSGVMLIYELATPEVIDISHLLPEDNFIEVEGGGTITAVNNYGYDVPSEITYLLKQEEQDV